MVSFLGSYFGTINECVGYQEEIPMGAGRSFGCDRVTTRWKGTSCKVEDQGGEYNTPLQKIFPLLDADEQRPNGRPEDPLDSGEEENHKEDTRPKTTRPRRKVAERPTGTHPIFQDSEVKEMTFCLAGLCSSYALTIFSRKFETLRLARQKSFSALLAWAHPLPSQSFLGYLTFSELGG